MTLTTLVLAAGDGLRFGRDVPKQFMNFETCGLPPGQMWRVVVENLETPSTVLIAMREEHQNLVDLSLLWDDVYPQAICLPKRTAGQLETLQQAFSRMVVSDDLLVVNCDMGFSPGVLDLLVEEGRDMNNVAVLTFPCNPEEASRWSWVDKHPWFDYATEKKLEPSCSNHALAGAYFFPADRVTKLCAVMQATINDHVRYGSGEPSISSLFSHFAGRTLSVSIHRRMMQDFGTAEAFQAYVKANR